jgi:hypothetical protein
LKILKEINIFLVVTRPKKICQKTIALNNWQFEYGSQVYPL